VTGEFRFVPGKDAREYSWAFRAMARLGCPVANAYRYYRTGSDVDASY
jgi:hypothetical protein